MPRPPLSDRVLRVLHVELARSRRFGRPVSVAVFVTAGPDGHADATRRSPRGRRTASFGEALQRLLEPHLRTFDTVATDGGHVIVVAPETDAAGTSAMTERLKAVASHEGIELRTGAATFPHDGQRPDDLLTVAVRRSTGTVTVAAGRRA